MRCLGNSKLSENESAAYERDVAIDALKGLAAFLVVLGHIVTYDAEFHRLYNVIYSFHMPLFMFLSGCTAVLSHRHHTGSDAAYLKRRFVNIMAPYFVWAFLLPLLSAGYFGKVNWNAVVLKTFVTNRMFWFLPVLYGLIAAYLCWQKSGRWLRSQLKRYQEDEKIGFLVDSFSCVLVVGSIAALMLLTGYQLFRDIVGFAIPFFGAVMYMEHEWIHQLVYRRVSLIAALVIYLLLIGRFDFDTIAITTSLLRMVLGMCSVVVLFQLFEKLPMPRFIVRLLSFWGRYSLLIYLLHIQVMNSLRMPEIGFLSKLTSCLAGRMAIHAMKVEDFLSKLTSCLACRLAGRMAIHAMKVEDFYSKLGTTVWYCTVSAAVCCICSIMAVALGRIPFVCTMLLGKKGSRI